MYNYHIIVVRNITECTTITSQLFIKITECTTVTSQISETLRSVQLSQLSTTQLYYSCCNITERTTITSQLSATLRNAQLSHHSCPQYYRVYNYHITVNLNFKKRTFKLNSVKNLVLFLVVLHLRIPFNSYFRFFFQLNLKLHAPKN